MDGSENRHRGAGVHRVPPEPSTVSDAPVAWSGCAALGYACGNTGTPRPISRGALRSPDRCPVQANGREPAPGRVPRGVVRRDTTAARLRTLPAFSSALAAPSLLEDVSFVWSGDASAGGPCLVAFCSDADTPPAWREKESVAWWSGAAASRPVPGGASRASFELFLGASRCGRGRDDGGVEPNRMGRYLKSGRNGHV